MTSAAAPHPVFLQQAQSLVQGGELLPGGVEELARRLYHSAETQQPLIVKLGLDPTRPDLHLGHSVVLRKLRAFQDLGHQAVMIIGDATALIGDPSGRNQTRPPLTEEEIQVNAQTYLEQAGKIIDVQKARIVRNSEWLMPLNLAGLLKLAAKITVAQMLTREDFNKRYTENKPISMHELLYPLMQAYDSVMIEADIELGGTDQRFNNLLGRDLQLAFAREKYGDEAAKKAKEPQMVLLLPLLEGTDGKIKMSKSYPEHCINLTDAPDDMYGKVMSIPDSLLARYELLLTPITEAQVNEQVALFSKPVEQGGINPRDVKAHLAKWIVSMYHSPQAGQQAEEAFIARFKRNEIPDDMPEVSLAAGTPYNIASLIADQGLAQSRSEARRLIQGGGVRLNSEKIASVDDDVNGKAGQKLILQVGKRKFLALLFD